jgi:hypothetical protein
MIEKNGKKAITLCKEDFLYDWSYSETVMNPLPNND